MRDPARTSAALPRQAHGIESKTAVSALEDSNLGHTEKREKPNKKKAERQLV